LAFAVAVVNFGEINWIWGLGFGNLGFWFGFWVCFWKWLLWGCTRTNAVFLGLGFLVWGWVLEILN